MLSFTNWSLICGTWLVVDICFLSLLPSSSMASVSFWALLEIDKIGHLLFYGSASVFFALGSSHRRKRIVLLFSILVLGIVLECAQYAMHQGRSFDLFDLMANGLGVGLGSLVFVLIDRIWLKKNTGIGIQ
ncbi:MAG TPA: VanZ family protein [Saprospiraceae bacterium]|nr:VanZ family protein [Saprospiraceae bacterium]